MVSHICCVCNLDGGFSARLVRANLRVGVWWPCLSTFPARFLARFLSVIFAWHDEKGEMLQVEGWDIKQLGRISPRCYASAMRCPRWVRDSPWHGMLRTGTNVGCAATHSLCAVQHRRRRGCYAHATYCPALTAAMVLRQVCCTSRMACCASRPRHTVCTSLRSTRSWPGYAATVCAYGPATRCPVLTPRMVLPDREEGACDV
eukprot:1578018-Rhodomonas_salina.3